MTQTDRALNVDSYGRPAQPRFGYGASYVNTPVKKTDVIIGIDGDVAGTQPKRETATGE